jgi:hypothetical protein
VAAPAKSPAQTIATSSNMTLQIFRAEWLEPSQPSGLVGETESGPPTYRDILAGRQQAEATRITTSRLVATYHAKTSRKSAASAFARRSRLHEKQRVGSEVEGTGISLREAVRRNGFRRIQACRDRTTRWYVVPRHCGSASPSNQYRAR